MRTLLTIDGSDPVIGRSVDVGADGMCVALPHPLRPGQTGTVRFDMFFDGKATPVSAKVSVIHAIFGGGEFKVGFKFTSLELAAAATIAKYVG
ncbi:MAG: PilZ domain-containing protein [Pseudomonadota bacterium]